MVTHPRAALRPDQLRPLNRPRPCEVTAERGLPVALVEGGRRVAVTAIHDRWRIEDEWWRQPVSRRYFTVLAEDGVHRTIFHDAAADRWFAQRYA